MQIGPKYKICKRLGSSVFEKCQTQKFMVSEARFAKSKRKRRRTLSDYGRQLIEKQKVRYSYGISERQLSRYVKEAVAKKGTDSIVTLFEKLESRLDNVIYRLGLANTRRLARQLASHGHITVNGKKMTIPSHIISVGDVIAIREGSKLKTPFVNLSDRLQEYKIPSWLSFDVKKMLGKIEKKPIYSSIEAPFDISTVLEFYSR